MTDPTDLYRFEVDVDPAQLAPGPMLVALDGFIDAGGAQRILVDHLLAASDARVVASFDVDSLIEATLFSVEGGASAATRLIGKGCTAIVCGSDLMALGAIRAARARGLRVPEDVSVIGYDDSALMAFTNPPLTTVHQAVVAMGEAAVRSLLDEIAGQPSPRAEYVFRPELVVRGSTGACRR